jgi:hypothetical protein
MKMGYRNAVAPFRFSGGESFVVTTDAQQNDYGVDFDPRRHVAQVRRSNPRNSRETDTHGTPENTTSDFGSVFYPFPPPAKRREKVIPVALRLKAGGAGATNGYTAGAVAGGMRSGSRAFPLDAISDPYTQPSIDEQSESAIVRRFSGQL